MANKKIKFFIEQVNLRILILALFMAIIGFVLLYLSSFEEFWRGRETWQAVVKNMSGFLVITGIITLLWELWVKRSFLDEILAKVRVAEEIKLAGIVRITDAWHRDIDWESYFSNVKKLDIFFAYSHTWRSNYDKQLKEIVKRKDVRIRVVLPDPEDNQVTYELARRFNYTPEKIRDLIIEAKEYFIDLKRIAANDGTQINIWFLPATPQFAFYRFDRIAIFTLYSHSRERTPVPAFVCEMGGTLYDYIRKEFEAMITEGGLAKRVTKEEN